MTSEVPTRSKYRHTLPTVHKNTYLYIDLFFQAACIIIIGTNRWAVHP